jgi:hypothetical protein
MNFFFLGVKGFKGIAGDLALGVQTQQLWAFQPLQNSQHLNLGITNLVDKAGNPLNKEGPQLLPTQCARYSVELKAAKCVVLPNTKYHSKRIFKILFFAPCDNIQQISWKSRKTNTMCKTLKNRMLAHSDGHFGNKMLPQIFTLSNKACKCTRIFWLPSVLCAQN